MSFRQIVLGTTTLVAVTAIGSGFALASPVCTGSGAIYTCSSAGWAGGSANTNTYSTINVTGDSTTNSGNALTISGTGTATINISSGVSVAPSAGVDIYTATYSGTSLTINNAGTLRYSGIPISSSAFAAIYGIGGNIIVNQAGGLITSSVASGPAISVATGTNSVTNYGTISYTGGGSTAAIKSNAWSGSTSALTVINSGTISTGTGSSGYAISFAAGASNRLELQPGSSITGIVDANASALSATLALGGASGSGTFDISSVGSSQQYRNFTALEKTGADTWTLTGTGTATAPFTVKAGTLAITGGARLGGNLTVNSGATLAGAGALGTMSVGGTATFNSGSIYLVRIDPSGLKDLLSVSGAATLAGSVQVQPATGSYTDGQSFTILTAGSLSGAFDGSSSLVSGYTTTLTRLGTNIILVLGVPSTTSSVSTTSSGGVIDTSQNFFDQSSDRARATTITFRGGTLKLYATTSFGQSIVIEVTGGTMDANGNIMTITGNITSQSGVLTISGTGGGEVKINGTYSGGTLTVDSSGVLRGTGTISGLTTVAGTLRPGNSPGTMVFSAPVVMQSAQSQLALDIDGTGTANGAGNYSRVLVQGSGNTFQANGLIQPVLRGLTGSATNTYTPPLGTKFTGVVQADGGVTGSFTGLTQPTSGLAAGTRFDTVYNTNSIDLYVTPASYGNLAAAGVGQTRNQSAVGGALDGWRPTAGTRPSGDTKTVFDALYTLDGSTLPGALSQIAGENQPNLSVNTIDISRGFGHSLTTRLGQVHGGASLAEKAQQGLTSLAFGSSGGDRFGWAAPGGQASGLAAGDAGAAAPDSGWGVWARGFGSFASNSGDGNNPGFRRNTGGGVAGADLPVLDDLRLGLSAGYARSDETGNRGIGIATIDSYFVGTYAGWTPGPWFVDAQVGATINSIDTKRALAFGGLSRTASGSTSGYDIGTELAGGYRLKVDEYTVEPSVSLRHDLVSTGGFTESGANSLNLTVKGETNHALRAGLGARVTRTFVLDNGVKVEPDVSARWEHDLLDQSTKITQSLSGQTFSVTGARAGRDAALLGTGVAAVMDENLKLYARYDAELRVNQTDHVVTAGLRYSW